MGTPSFVAVLLALARRTWRKTFERPVHLAFGFVQPLFWLLFFGFLFQRYSLVDLDPGLTYLDFLVPGVCAMTVLFGASQSGIGWIRDHQTGFLERMLQTPAPPLAILGGKILADVARLLVQAALVALLALALGAHLRFAPLELLAALLALALFATAFASLSNAIALTVRAPEPMATYVHLVNMPLLFTSTALVPTKHMPAWLATIAAWNPLTLVVNALRSAFLAVESDALFATLLPLLFLALASFLLAGASMPTKSRR
jgi:ABC-2 type transport system permease protein